MKTKLPQLVSYLGLAIGSMRSSKSQETPPTITVGAKEKHGLNPGDKVIARTPTNRDEQYIVTSSEWMPDNLHDAVFCEQPSRGLWLSPFNRREHRQGRGFRSQRSRSNRRKASR